MKVMNVPVILVYHSVRPNSDGGIYGTALTPERFERHITYLSSHYRIVPLHEFVNNLASRTKSQGMLSITFDDGFADNLDEAAETLRRHRLEATVSVTTGFVGRPYFWWDALHAMKKSLETRPDIVAAELSRHSTERISGVSPSWFRDVWDQLRRLYLDDAYSVVETLASAIGHHDVNLPRPVNAHELRKLARWPFSVSSHAVTHRPLTALSLKELEYELTFSREFLETHTGKRVETLSYPFGLYERVVALSAERAGYSQALSVYPSLGHKVSFMDRFGLMRVDASDCDVDGLQSYLEKYDHANRYFFSGPLAKATTARSNQPPQQSLPQGKHVECPPLDPVIPLSPAPLHRLWGFENGTPLDRPFIKKFIATYYADIRGDILEIKEPVYAQEFACVGSKITVLDVDGDNLAADVIDDLQTGTKLATASFDCVILTQVLQLIPIPEAAVATIARILRPGGVLLITVPGISQTMVEGGFYQCYYEPGLRLILRKFFDPEKLILESHGNAGLAAAFILGMTHEEVPHSLFSVTDVEYPIVITARAVKPEEN